MKRRTRDYVEVPIKINKLDKLLTVDFTYNPSSYHYEVRSYYLDDKPVSLDSIEEENLPLLLYQKISYAIEDYIFNKEVTYADNA